MNTIDIRFSKAVHERVIPSVTNSRYLVLTFLSSHIKEIAERVLKGRKRLMILDVGCGLKPYQPYFRNVDMYIGIDKAILTENLKANDVSAVAEGIPFRDDSFNIVVCTQVLEHMTFPEKGLKEMHRVVKTKGKLIISTHGIWVEGHETPDLWRWTAEGLRRMLCLSGFRIQEVYSMDPLTSLFQLMLLYVPNNKISKHIVYPCLNVVAKMLIRLFSNSSIILRKATKLHVVHIIVASKT